MTQETNLSKLQEELDTHLSRILKKNIRRLTKNVAAFSSTDPEAIHAIRVSTRKLREIIKIHTNTSTKTSKEFHKLFHLLGAKRNLDVFSEYILSKIKSNPALTSTLHLQMDEARKNISDMLNSNYYANLVIFLEGFTQVKINKDHLLKTAIGRLNKVVNKILKIAPAIDLKVNDKTLHKLRIAIKKFRYLCEFLDPFFKKHIFSLTPFIKKTKKIQTILGDYQDAITGLSMLASYKNELSREEYKLIKNEFEAKKKTSLKSFFKVW